MKEIIDIEVQKERKTSVQKILVEKVELKHRKSSYLNELEKKVSKVD